MKEKIELNSEAINLRKEFGEDYNSSIDIFSLVHNNDDLTIVFYPMSSRLSGVCIRDGKNKIIGVNSKSTYGRQRFTIAHELYHLFFHENFSSIVCFKDLEMNKDVKEKEADIFASYFLAPYEALVYFIKEQLGKNKQELNIEDVVKIEQNFGISRQATLWRLVNDGFLTKSTAETMKVGIISSARRLGYDDTLYTPTPENKQYGTFGKYIKLAENLKNKDKISHGKYEEILLNAFRSDIIYGFDLDEEELYD